jgi:hypothetical protein
MSTTVRLFAYAGISQAFVANFAGQKANESVTLFKQPYLARESLTADTGTAVSSTSALSPPHSRILHVQVEPGKRVHYEISPPGRENGPVAADTSSPVIQGDEQFEWGSSWTISLLEAS